MLQTGFKTRQFMQLRIGTRKSTLALTQAEILQVKLMESFSALSCELVPIVTTGDRKTGSLADIGGKGLFTRELEEALLEKRIDIAVHSLKDMETHLPAGLVIGAVLARDDPRDAFVAKKRLTLTSLPRHARVGTSSPRRTVQVKIARPDLEIVLLRGNVTTRLDKLRRGEVDATVLAFAGLKRLHLESEATEILDTQRFIPAAGQGTIAVECRDDDHALREMLTAINDPLTYTATLTERSLLATVGGSCRTPIGAYARIENGKLRLDAMLAKPDGSAHAHVFREGNVSDAVALGKDAGAELLARGAKDWLA